MNVEIGNTYRDLSIRAAEEIINLVKSNPNAVLSLAAGDTPGLTSFVREKLNSALFPDLYAPWCQNKIIEN